MGDDDVGDAALAGFGHDLHHLGRRDMAGRERQLIVRDEIEHLEHRRQQGPVPRHDDVGPRLLEIADLGLGIVRRHPHDLAIAALDLGEVAHRLRVDAADRRVEHQPAEHFEPRHIVIFPDEISEAGRLAPMVLEHQAAHAALARDLRNLERVPLAIVGIGPEMRMDVDRPLQHGILEMLLDRALGELALERFPRVQ